MAPQRQFHLARWVLLLLLIATQVGVSLAMRQLPLLGAVHGMVIAAYGFYVVLKKDLLGIITVFAYLTGSEVLWRQVRAPLPYLFAPYVLIGLSVIAVIVLLGKVSNTGRQAALYIALLLPPIVITARTGGDDARELIAFALSGPIALGTLVMLTSQLAAKPAMYRRILWATLISTIGPLTIALADVQAVLAVYGSISFSTQSNSITSGGFGPVQVSSALGLGVLCAVLLIISERQLLPRVIASLAGFVLIVQTLLTFSRGGSFSVGIALAVVAVVQARNRRVRNRVAAIATVALVLAYFLVFPWLDSFTAGKFQERFSSTRSARTELAANDTEIFKRNFMFGVGPGMTKYQRLTYTVCQLRNDKCNAEASSHTEFTRMLGEHGIPGIMAMVVLAVLIAQVFRTTRANRLFAVAFITWAVAQMFYANLRVVAVPFAFGIAFLSIRDDRASSDDPPADSATRPLRPQHVPAAIDDEVDLRPTLSAPDASRLPTILEGGVISVTTSRPT